MAVIRLDLTLMLMVPIAVSEARRATRQSSVRDRMEEADRAFFERVEYGYNELAVADPRRIRVIDATQSIEKVSQAIWDIVNLLV